MSSSIDSTSLDYDSFDKVTGGSEQVAIYGWGHCKYLEVTQKLMDGDATHKPRIVFDYTLGSSQNTSDQTLEGNHQTLEGKAIAKIDHNRTDVKTISKYGISNLITENAIRSIFKLPIIPLIFCIDVDDNIYPTTPELVLSRGSKTLITSSELRRVYKHLKEFEGTALGEVAKKTFIFVKVKTQGKKFSFESTVPPWEMEGWSEQMEKRKATKKEKSSTSSSSNSKTSWREGVENLSNHNRGMYKFWEVYLKIYRSNQLAN